MQRNHDDDNYHSFDPMNESDDHMNNSANLKLTHTQQYKHIVQSFIVVWIANTNC